MSTSTQQFTAMPTSLERRFYPRIAPQAPVFITFDEANESLLLNVSENGLLLSPPAELSGNFVARISIPLDGFPKPVQVSVRVVWASETRKLAGIQLLNLSEHDRERIHKWGARISGFTRGYRSRQSDCRQRWPHGERKPAAWPRESLSGRRQCRSRMTLSTYMD